MSRTKMMGYLIVIVSLLNTVIDIFNGNGFDLSTHLNEIIAALGGAGLVFLRSAVEKIK